jgi:glycosyltransferase involved in cell wall biosynthesis
MHVLITTDTVGGVWTYTRELVAGLSRRGVRVTLVSFGGIPAPDQIAWMDDIKALDYRPTAFPLEWMQGAEREIEESQSYLEGMVRELKPDILHLSQYAYGNVAPEVHRVLVTHSDVISWWVSVNGEEPPQSAWLRWYRETVNTGLSRADAVVAPSQWMLDTICTHYGEPRRGVVIYNGRTPDEFAAHPAKQPFVLAVGRLWDRGKQVSLLTGATHTVPICIAGSEDHPEAQYRGAIGLGAGTSNLKLLGRQSQEQLRTLYAQASTYAATSCYEPFGLAPLEAALSQCALVANDIPVFHELWGDSACYFRKNDAQSLSRAIREITNNPALRSNYAQSAYERGRSKFSAERMCIEYERLYRTLMPRTENA